MTTKPSNHPFAKLQALRTTEPAKPAGEGPPGRPLAPGVSTRPPAPPPKRSPPPPPPREDPASSIKQAAPKPIASSAPSPTAAQISSHPFAKLQALRTASTAAPAGAAPGAAVGGAGPEGKGPAWAVIRLERKGRGGKEATVVEKLGLPPDALEQWCKDLKQTLGCGGVVEGEFIILQGDLRARLPAVLTKRGVRKVTVG